jgi:plasmid stabilization system protein ParE
MKSFEIIWSNHAENELDSIFNYYSEFANFRVAKKLIQDILTEPNKLLLNQEISQREELLMDRENEYRYLVCKNYKIIYSVDTNAKQIKIADVFDSRQNPIKIKRTK